VLDGDAQRLHHQGEDGVTDRGEALVRGPQSQLTRAEPKTRRSRRVLDMPARVVEALRKHRDAQKLRHVSGDDFVFKTSAGTPIDPSNLRRFFDEVCESAGLGHCFDVVVAPMEDLFGS